MKKYFAFFLGILLGSSSAQAGAFEFSTALSYSHSQYSEVSYNSRRKIGFSVGYYFTELSELEFSFENVRDRTHVENYQDTTTTDAIYGVNLVQSLAGKQAPVQPYFKLGAGQLNRETTGSYANGASPAAIVDSLTVIAGIGMRIYLTKGFAIRAEGTSYLTGGIRTWSDNFAATIGVSLFF